MLISFFVTLQNLVTDRLERDDKGATAVEYGLMVALIAVVIMATVALLGGNLNRLFGLVNTRLTGITG